MVVVLWIVFAAAFALLVGIGIGRHFENADLRERDRLLDEADREIASFNRGMKALGRATNNGS